MGDNSTSHTIPARGKDKNQTAALWPHADCTLICDVIVMLKWRHNVASSRIGDFLEAFFHVSNIKCDIYWWERKIIHYSCENGIEKSVPRDHRSSSLGKPRDANRWSSERIFLSHPHTHDRFLLSSMWIMFFLAVCTCWPWSLFNFIAFCVLSYHSAIFLTWNLCSSLQIIQAALTHKRHL